MRKRLLPVLLAAAGSLLAQEPASPPQGNAFDQAAGRLQPQLELAVAELRSLREQIVAEKVPLARQLNELQVELARVRQEFQEKSREIDTRTLDISKLQDDIKKRQDEAGYLSNLFGEYVRNFESRLHIAELHRYEQPLAAARLAPENTSLAAQEVYAAQTQLLGVALDRLHEALSGARFDGSAVHGGLVQQGSFVVVGPVALFRSADGRAVGTVEQVLNSHEPNVIGFGNPGDAAAAAALVTGGEGLLPLDPTLGNAHKVESVKETLWEHVQKGGPVMVPIFVLAGAALLVVLYKWLVLLLVRRPSQPRLAALLAAVARRDRQGALQQARAVGGPTGEMLTVGVEHLGEPRELIEEVMYEGVLATRLRLQRFLPFVAIAAASAPLLGLLGTVTGIMNTFELITQFGTGDPKVLSSGISEALITTEYGLIVAIPSLLLHAFLSRRARGFLDQMEKAAVTFLNQVGKTHFERARITADADPEAAPAGVESAAGRREVVA